MCPYRHLVRDGKASAKSFLPPDVDRVVKRLTFGGLGHQNRHVLLDPWALVPVPVHDACREDDNRKSGSGLET